MDNIAYPTRYRMARALVAAAGLAALLVLPAAAKVVTGTPGSDTLTGTVGKDTLDGRAGNDTLKGLAGDDTYLFQDGWGVDRITEKDSYRVKGKKVPGGLDTLDLRGVNAERIEAFLVPRWRELGFSRVQTTDGDRIELGASPIERVLGSPDEDSIAGGDRRHILTTGGGGRDTLVDFGGWDDGPGGRPELPPSNDTYAGVAANTGLVFVEDWGGNDVLDLRPLRLDRVLLLQFDCDSALPGTECLRIVTGTGGAGEVIVLGQFGPRSNTVDLGQDGQIETLRFADKTVTFRAANRRSGAIFGMALLGKATTPHQKELASKASALGEEKLRQEANSSLVAGLPDITGQDAGRDRGRHRQGDDRGSDAGRPERSTAQEQEQDRGRVPDNSKRDRRPGRQAASPSAAEDSR